MNYWLMKSEPETYGIGHLIKENNQTEHWDGVRNYQARNFMRDEMKIGDQAFFYHSNCKEPGIVGIVNIVKEAYPDHTAFDKNSQYYDPKSNPDNPRWIMVDVQFERQLKRLISLAELKTHAEQLNGLSLLNRGNRLSIMPVSKKHWDFILALE